MIDLKILRENPELIRTAIKNRGEKLNFDEIIELDRQRRENLIQIEALRRERNSLSKEVARLRQKNKEAATIIPKAKAIAERIKVLEQKQEEITSRFNGLIDWIPNIPHKSVPIGQGSEANQFVRGLKEPPSLDFKPLPHWEIGEALDILDLKRASKISGSRFILYKGAGAALERALINFFLDVHTTNHHYIEVFPPVLNSPYCLYGTGQLPKLKADMYQCQDEFYLAPTAEVPLTNMHREEIIPEKNLPICYVAYTPCFRREAGSYGKEVRGIKRVHQFNKVELVKYTTPEQGYKEFEGLLSDAEKVVQLLKLPYRILLLCSGDMTFASAKTYDIEIYAPGMDEWLEVSSISCYEKFQARRASIRYRRADGGVDYVYTMNGSGLATPRIFIAIVENYQTKDGRIRIPDVLKKYMNNMEYIE